MANSNNRSHASSPIPTGRAEHPLTMATTSPSTPSRVGTPDDVLGSASIRTFSNPFGDNGDAQASSSHHHRRGEGVGGPSTDGGGERGVGGSTGADFSNPFASPSGSAPASTFDSSSAAGVAPFEERMQQRYFHSRRVRKGEMEKPWTKNVDPKEKWVSIIPMMGIIVGLGIAGVMVWDGIRSVVKHKYCLVLDEDWSGGINPNVWQQEVQLGGFGNGEFEMTTAGPENVYINNGHLIIKATPQDDRLMEKDSAIDMLKDGTCTSTDYYSCVAATNTTVGNTSVVPPTVSGRITTLPGASIRYGRVEVTAKMPQGDWLWPAIWMMPVDSVYGTWPRSGEIDIAESRGNNHTYPQGGNNIVSSALHWGPNPHNDGFWRTNNKRAALHTTYSADFRTFGLEWSQKYIFTYIGSRLLQVLYTDFDTPFWLRGGFPNAEANGSRLDNPWASGTGANAPFDQRFFLILNLAVGGTNGWFHDGDNGKPWVDASPTAKRDFWNARTQWLPTWTQPQMEVSKVVIWQQCDGNEGL